MSEIAFKKEIEEMKQMRQIFEDYIQKISSTKSDSIEIKEMLKKQNDRQLAFELKVQPMLDAFNRSTETRIVWTRTGVTIKKTAAWITTILGAAIAIKYGLKYLLELILKK